MFSRNAENLRGTVKRLEKWLVDGLVGTLSKILSIGRGEKRAVVMLLDGLLCCFAVLLAYYLRLGTWDFYNRPIGFTVGVALFAWYPIAHYMRIYKAIFRYGGSGMMVNLFKACLLLAVVFSALFMAWPVRHLPRTIAIIQPMIFFLMLIMSRIAARYLLSDVIDQAGYGKPTKNVLIYGAGHAGRQLAASIRHEPSMRLFGFIDEDETLRGKTLDSSEVYHPSELARLIGSEKITDVLLALPNMRRSERHRLVEELQQYDVHVMLLPKMSHIVEGQVSFSDLQELRIEDLLGRDPVPPNEELLDKTIRNKNVLVTGAGGSIGSELCRQIIAHDPALIVLMEMTEFSLYSIEMELRETMKSENLGDPNKIVPILGNAADPIAVKAVFDHYKPDTVFHAAAYKHVPLVEANPGRAILNNILATRCLALEARRAGVTNFILISTDKAVRPTNFMGASKRVCELILQALAARSDQPIYAMVRFGNVLGSSGSVVPRFERQIRSGGPVTLTHRDITRYFMTIPEAAQLVIQAGAMAKGGEVFVLDMGDAVRIIDLAKTMIKLSGLSVRDSKNPGGDIEIREVGLRPGEKLYEELLIGDNPMPTEHDRIMCANEVFIDWDILQAKIEAMEAAYAINDDSRIDAIIRELVPGYAPTSPSLLPQAQSEK